MWIIWTRRNETQLKQVVPELAKVLGEACQYLSEFKKYDAMPVKVMLENLVLAQTLQVKPLKMVKWKPSNSNCYKTNFDSAVFVDSGEIGIRVVVRNAWGLVLASLFEKIPNPHSVAVLELLVARRAVSFIKEIGLDNSVSEGDSEIIINALKNGDMFHFAYGNLLLDTLSLLNSLKSWSLSHTLRLSNAIAYALARKDNFSFPLSIWLESVPPNIINYVNSDLPAS
ncbi:uncharacterized protein LOC142608997 [Castanea sativa]|uniref:uncharacterized protein LOC142608997 n=1 Tax=Castanea sativa TaxID=21020 RepID=UPI003F649810